MRLNIKPTLVGFLFYWLYADKKNDALKPLTMECGSGHLVFEVFKCSFPFPLFDYLYLQSF